MGDVNCIEVVQLLNNLFGTPLILNDGHEILARLEDGADLVDMVNEANKKFGNPENEAAIRRTVGAWPPLHREAVGEMIRWALSKLDTKERVVVKYRGDAESPRTVTKFELEGNVLVVEFAHPPFRPHLAPAGS